MYNRLIEQSVNVNADNKALEHRNKLLEFDRTRFEIIDIRLIQIFYFILFKRRKYYLYIISKIT